MFSKLFERLLYRQKNKLTRRHWRKPTKWTEKSCSWLRQLLQSKESVIPPQVIDRVRIVPRPGFLRDILSYSARLFLNLFDIQRLKNVQSDTVILGINQWHVEIGLEFQQNLIMMVCCRSAWKRRILLSNSFEASCTVIIKDILFSTVHTPKFCPWWWKRLGGRWNILTLERGGESDFSW